MKKLLVLITLFAIGCGGPAFDMPLPDDQQKLELDGDVLGSGDDAGSEAGESDANRIDSKQSDAGPGVDSAPVVVDSAPVVVDSAPIDTGYDAGRGENCTRSYALDAFCSDPWSTGKGPTNVYNGGCLTSGGGPCSAWVCPNPTKHPVAFKCEDRDFGGNTPTSGKAWCCRETFGVHERM